MRKVIEDDLGEPLEDVFAEFDEEAVAAASIGQVYRARLHDGRDVAVKVQYPGVAQAVRADLQNLGLIMRVAKRIAPGHGRQGDDRARSASGSPTSSTTSTRRSSTAPSRAPGAGTRSSSCRRWSRASRSEHVLVTEWVDGIGFEEVRELDARPRDRFGEIVFRFFFGSLYRNGHFSGDPHPGNYLLMPDGRVAFLDFGMTKRRRARAHRRRGGGAPRSAMDGDAEGLHAALAGDGLLRPGRRRDHARAPCSSTSAT